MVVMKILNLIKRKFDVVGREVRHIFFSLRIVSRFVDPMNMNVSRDTSNLDAV